MVRFLQPLWAAGLITCALIVANITLELISIYLLSPLVTDLSDALGSFSGASLWDWFLSPSAARLRQILTYMLLAQIALGVLIYASAAWHARFGMKLLTHMRAGLYDHLQNMAFFGYDQMTGGKILSRALGDLQAVHGFINTSLFTGLEIGLSVTSYLVLLWFRSPWLMLAAVLPMPFWCYLIYRFSERSKPLYQRQQQAYDQLMVKLSENMSAIQVVKAFGKEDDEIGKYQKVSQNFRQRLMGVVVFQSKLNPLLQGITVSLHISLFVLTAWLIQRGDLRVGDLMIVGAAMGAILGRLQQIHHTTQFSRQALVSGERLIELLDMPLVERANDRSPKLEITRGEVEFRNVSFGYGTGLPVLNNFSMTLPAGKVTAVLGPTGSGKTTMSALIAKFYEPQQGEILIDGHPITEIDAYELRKQVGFVFQETFLFTDTIAGNIRYGRRDVSDEMLRAAAHVAHADEFIEKLPQGYETSLGEHGVQLSGGQRQRLALARALVYDPKILVLDDITSALDATTEAKIRARLEEVFLGRTVLLITTRLTNLSIADHIVQIEGGHALPCSAS